MLSSNPWKNVTLAELAVVSSARLLKRNSICSVLGGSIMLRNTRITASRHVLKKLHCMNVFVKLEMKIEKIPVSKKNEINRYIYVYK